MLRGAAAGAASAGLIGLLGFSAAARAPESTETVDFRVTRTAVKPAYDATLHRVSEARAKEFIIPVTHDTIEIAEGVVYEGWTFGGTVPGPTIRAREGDRVKITLINESPMAHSIDFHSARIPANEAYKTIAPGEQISFEFVARDPGVYVVHCGTPPITLHIMQGMYLAMIVDPKEGWGTEADREFVLTQSEFYSRWQDGSNLPDFGAAMDKKASFVTFNGKAFQYKGSPLQVELGERVRFFVANAGPSFRSDFHLVGAVFDRVYADGNPGNALEGVQTWTIPAGGGAVFETVFEEGASGEGFYPFVTHAFADADKGAVGMIRVGQPKVATMAH
jgi:nitrite reductase (NO-forming)